MEAQQKRHLKTMRRKPTKSKRAARADNVRLSLRVCGPLHAIIMSNITSCTTKTQLVAQLGMPKRVVAVIVDSLVKNGMVTCTPLDARVCMYSPTEIETSYVEAILGKKEAL
jgi:hypothetical protein